MYKDPLLYLVLNLFKLFVINPSVPELMPESDENLSGHHYRQSLHYGDLVQVKFCESQK